MLQRDIIGMKNGKKYCNMISLSSTIQFWLVVSIPLKNISQLVLLFPIYGKIKNVPNHQPVNWRFAMAIWWDRNHHRFHCPDVPHPPGAPASCVMNICLGQNRLENSRCWKGIWNRRIKESRLQQDQQGFVKLQ